MKINYMSYLINIAVFIGVWILVSEFVEDKLWIYICGMIGFVISEIAGDIAELVYYKNEITLFHGKEDK